MADSDVNKKNASFSVNLSTETRKKQKPCSTCIKSELRNKNLG